MKRETRNVRGRSRVGQGAKVVSLTLEKGLLEGADAFARRHGLSGSELVAESLRDKMGRAARGAGQVLDLRGGVARVDERGVETEHDRAREATPPPAHERDGRIGLAKLPGHFSTLLSLTEV
jgi:hypothetical protein